MLLTIASASGARTQPEWQPPVDDRAPLRSDHWRKRWLVVLGVVVAVAVLNLMFFYSLVPPRAPVTIKEIRQSSFGHYLDSRVMTKEYSIRDRLFELQTLPADQLLAVPGRTEKLKLQLPEHFFARACWVPSLNVAVGTISALDWKEYQQGDQYKAEAMVIAGCQAVCWNESGKLYPLSALLPDKPLTPKRLSVVVESLDKNGSFLIAGPMPLAHTVNTTESGISADALKRAGLSSGELFGPPEAYEVVLQRR